MSSDAARSRTSPTGNRPFSSLRPVSRTMGASGSNARTRNADRAARAARSVAGPSPTSKITSTPLASSSTFPPNGSSSWRTCTSIFCGMPWAGIVVADPLVISIAEGTSATTETKRFSVSVMDSDSGNRRWTAIHSSWPSVSSAFETALPSAGRCAGSLESICVTRLQRAAGTSVRISSTRGGSSMRSLARSAMM